MSLTAAASVVSESRVDIVIVHYSPAESTERLLKQLHDFSKSQGATRLGEVVVVSSGSPDPVRIRTFGRFIDLPTNVGFGSGMNIGVQQTSAEFVLLLNPDIVLDLNSFLRYLDLAVNKLAESPDHLMTGGYLRLADGIQDIAGPRPTLQTMVRPRKHSGRLNTATHLVELEVNNLTTAAVVVARGRFLELGGFDPRYFLYFEDADLCRRASLSKLKMFVHPIIIGFHDRGLSSRGKPSYSKLLVVRKSQASYVNRWYGLGGRLVFAALLALSIPRMARDVRLGAAMREILEVLQINFAGAQRS